MTPAFPAGFLSRFNLRHMKPSSPQIPLEDMQIIHVVFAGSAIRAGFGKLAAILLSVAD
jgi:hypothetical protein